MDETGPVPFNEWDQCVCRVAPVIVCCCVTVLDHIDIWPADCALLQTITGTTRARGG
jgi:hypothetical protein